MILGITGPSGAGKGTVSKILENWGFYHIDTDRLVPGVYPQALDPLTEAFGRDILTPDGQVDKPSLAKKAFQSPENLEMLNAILHPRIMARAEEILGEQRRLGRQNFCLDGAALYEAHGERICDKILCVLAPREDRLARIMKRDGIDRERALARLNRQKPDEFYSSRADFVVWNRDIDTLRENIKQIKEQLEHE